MIRNLIAGKEIKWNLIIYFIFLLLAVTGIFYGQSIQSHFSFLRLWNYQNILLLLLGVPFLFLQTRASLPNFLDDLVSHQQRFFTPLMIGSFFGILDIIVIKLLLHPEPYTALPPFLQPFPYSLFLYFSGALEIEVFYRLIPLTLILLLGKRVAKGKYFDAFFWAGAILTALREPIEQWPNGNLLFMIYALLTGFMMNFLQAIHYKKSGFLASLAIRLGHYLFWHILLGMYVQYFELQ